MITLSKKIIICGAGEVGKHASEILTKEDHDVTVIDFSSEKLKELDDYIDVGSIKGNSCHPDILKEAGIAQADLLLAATDKDEVNLLTATLAKKMGCKKVIARVHERATLQAEVLDYKKALDIDHIICPEKLTSNEITSKITDPGVMEIEHFADNQLEMHRYEVKNSSKIVGKSLSQVNFPKDIRAAVIKRESIYIIPEASTILEANDIITLIGKPDAFLEVQSMFKKPETNKSIAIMGATTMSAWLVDDFLKKNYSIRVFESNREKAIEFSEQFPSITVINSDPINPNEFETERLSRCVAFIAVTEDDEHNILGALQAKKFGVATTVSVIHSNTFISLLGPLGIDLPFSPRMVAAKSILGFIDESLVKSISILAPDVAEIYEVGPVRGGEGVGVHLRHLSLPKGSFIAAIQRGGEVTVPGAKDIVCINDIIIIIGPSNINKELKKMFIKS